MPTTETSTKPLQGKKWDCLYEVLKRFEKAWQGPGQPVIEDYLKAGQVERQELLLELIHTDLECRWRAGEEIRVESYFQRYPEIGADREAALGLIAAEYHLRQRREPSLTPEDYQRRFPQYQSDLPARLIRLQQRVCLPSHLGCPYCHKLISLADHGGRAEGGGSVRQITCSSCGGSFRFDAAHVPVWSPQALPRLGPFELLKEVGQGAFGTVYRARDTQLGRIVAVKVPRIGHWFTPVEHDRFVREARNVAQLSHAGIVPIYDVGRGAPVPYLVSAYVAGETLANVLARRRFGFREAAEIGAQVAEALDHAHRHGVVHRDLKPSNIMLGQIEGAASAASTAVRDTALTAAAAPDDSPVQAFVMDFGLSRREEGELTVTLEGQVLGTPAYMSPEQARGQGHHVDGRSDVYSLGVILYELVTGEIPFRGVTRMVLEQIQFEEPRAPRRLNDKIPRDLETIVLKCMAKEPGRRYATAGEVAADLRRYLNREPILARPVSRLERCWRWTKRNPRVASLLSLVVLLLATVVVGSVLATIQIGQERDAANVQLNLALKTLDQLVDQVNDQLRDKPAMHKLAENLLLTAMEGLKEVAQNRPIPRAINESWNTIAAANQRLGDIHLVLGQTDKANEYFQAACTQLEAYVAANPQTTIGRRNLAITYRRRGEIALRQSNMSVARSYYQKALEIVQALAAAAAPGDPLALRDLSDGHMYCGNVSLQVEDWPAALREYQAALEFARAAVETAPQSTAYRQTLADRHEKVGQALLGSGNPVEAARHFEQALQLRAALAGAAPDSRTALRSLAQAHRSLSHANYYLLRLPLALKHAHRAVDLLEKLAADDPQDAEVGRQLGLAYALRGDIHAKRADFAAVRADRLKSVSIIRHWAAADRENLSLQMELGFAYHDLGRTEMSLRDYEQAASYFQQGIAILQDPRLQAKLKDQPRAQRALAGMQHKLRVCQSAKRAIADLDFALAQPPVLAAELLYIRAAVLAGRGQYQAAGAAADKLAALNPKNVSYLYDAACAYALCVAGVGQGKSASQLTTEEAAARKRYAGRAIETLAALIQLNFQDARNIELDPDLAAIRQEEGYRTLLARLKTSRKPSK